MIVIGKERAKVFLKLSVLQRVFSLMIIKTVRCPSHGGPILKRLVLAKSVHFMKVSVLQRCSLAES